MEKIKQPTLGETLTICGETRHIVDGEIVYEARNAISDDLKGYLKSVLDTGSADNALNSLFNAPEVPLGGAQDGNDGVAVKDADVPEWITMVTTTMVANNTFGKRWQGEISSLSQARTIDASALGWNFDDVNPIHFETVFATQGFTGIPLTSGAQYILEWEIYIV